jgi:FixJ family two-component response regulator
MSATPIVYVVDDDAAIRVALQRLLCSADIHSQAHATADEFLQLDFTERPTCLLLDVNLSVGTGFDLQHELTRRGHGFPIIFMTGFGTIPLSVRAIKAGAHEFLTKPFEPDHLLELIREALDQDAVQCIERTATAVVRERFASLTPREREVMALLITGKMNKQIALELGTSEVTAKVHKRHVMTKMNARTVIELLKMRERLGPLASFQVTPP